MGCWQRRQEKKLGQGLHTLQSINRLEPSSSSRRKAGALILAFAVVVNAFAASAHAEVMTTCTSEIGRYCADVNKGEGRVVACLVSQMGRLGPACQADVQELGPMAPGAVRIVFNPGFRLSLPEACAQPAAKLCPRMKAGEGRVFACLYARSDRIPKACSDAAQAALAGAK